MSIPAESVSTNLAALVPGTVCRDYVAALAVWVAAAVSLGARAVRDAAARVIPSDAGFLAAAAASVPLAFASSLWFSMNLDDQPQARHTLGAATGFALCVAFGVTAWLRRPALRMTAAVAYLLLFAWFCLDGYDAVCGL